MDPLLFLVTQQAMAFFRPEPVEVEDSSSPTGDITFAYVPCAVDIPVVCFSTKMLSIHDIWYAVIGVRKG